MCKCAEGFITTYTPNWAIIDRKPIVLKKHNCEYIRQRNLLIDKAENLTREFLDDKDEERFSSVFIQTMNRLVREAGI